MSDLLQLAGAALSLQGAIVETEGPDSLLVALPKKTASELGLPEWATLTTTPEAVTASQILVAPQSPLLEKLQAIVEESGHFTVLQLPDLPLKEIDPAQWLERHFSVLNGTYRLLSSDVRPAAYYLFHFRYNAVSDDRLDGIVSTCVRADAQSAPWHVDDLVQRAEISAGLEPTAADLDAGELRTCHQAASRLAVWQVQRVLADFEKSLLQRLRRDAQRTREYFAELEAQVERRLARRKGMSGEFDRAQDQIRALRLECRRQILELTDKSRVQVKLAILAVARVSMRARHIEVEVRRRRQAFKRTLVWNPADRALESLLCAACGGPTSSIAVCDERLHVICAGCYPACDVCGHPYCRKCHPSTCPRRHP